MTEKQSIHSSAPVPPSQRQGPFTMGLLWITMVTFFPSLLMGFEWYKNGFTGSQILISLIIGCLILLAYTLPATQLGAQTGLGYVTLSRGVFGRWGIWLVVINLIWIFMLFYGLGALFTADSLNGLFNLQWSLPWFAAGTAIIMSCNNFFGFKGIANFARYIAAPMLIVWVLYSFYKAINHFPLSTFAESPNQSFASALTTVSSFTIGYAVWGNEKDYWRYSVPKPIYAAIPLTVALIIGPLLFPITGWMIAKMTGITESAAATAYMNNYSFGGIACLGALVLSASYFAANDSCLFAVIQGCETVKQFPHKLWVLIMAITGAIIAFTLSISGTAKSLEAIASLNSFIMPIPTVIMLTEWFLLAKIFKISTKSHIHRHDIKYLPLIRWPAFIALLSGLSIGLLTAGVIPGCESFHVGICSVQAWLTAAVVYIPLRFIEHQQMISQNLMVLERVLARRFEQASARLPITL